MQESWRVILIVTEEVSRENLVSRPSSQDTHDILKEVQELKREVASQLASLLSFMLKHNI